MTDHKTFIFKYDPESSAEGMFASLQQVITGELKLVEPHIIRSNSIEALLTGVTKERLELFSVLVQKRPNSLTELANHLSRNYQEVKKDAEILAAWGVIELRKEINKIQPIVLYEEIVIEGIPSLEKPSLQEEKKLFQGIRQGEINFFSEIPLYNINASQK